MIAYDVALVLLPATLLGSTVGVFLNKMCSCNSTFLTSSLLHLSSSSSLSLSSPLLCLLLTSSPSSFAFRCPTWLIVALLVLLCAFSGHRTLEKVSMQRPKPAD